MTMRNRNSSSLVCLLAWLFLAAFLGSANRLEGQQPAGRRPAKQPRICSIYGFPGR